jgi:hypothetical protein
MASSLAVADADATPLLFAVAAGPERVDGRGLSRAALRARFEDASRPAVLTGLTDAWRAREAWRPALLAARFPARRFDVGRASRATVLLSELLAADGGGGGGGGGRGGGGGDATASAFETIGEEGVAGAAGNAGAAALPPEYVFDSAALDEDASLAADFAPPPCFPPQDGLLGTAVFAAVPALRPEWRWLLVGAAGAGFTCHVDPHGTCAWNALLVGKKRWAMLPPDTPAELVLPSQRCDGGAGGSGGAAGDERADEAPPLDATTEASARAWFAHQLPRLAAVRAPGLLLFEQCAGECVFIPAGWWHVAITTEGPSVAITQNYLGELDFERMCDRAGPEAAARWRARAAAGAAE